MTGIEANEKQRSRDLQGFVPLSSSRVIAPEMTGTGIRAPLGSTWLGYVDTQYKALGLHREITEQWGYDKLTGALHEKLSDAKIEKLTAEGAAWSEDQAVEEALKV